MYGGVQFRTVVERDQSFEDVLKEELAGAFEDLEIERIGINSSESTGIADGLSATFLELLQRALGPERSRLLVSAETAVLSFRSKKLSEEIDIYRRSTAITREILHQAFTDGFLVPGKTTQAELRNHVQALAAERGYTDLAWEADSCPGVYSGLFTDLSHAEPTAKVIQPGDILWVDFGIRDSGLATDMIRAGYLLLVPPQDTLYLVPAPEEN